MLSSSSSFSSSHSTNRKITSSDSSTQLSSSNSSSSFSSSETTSWPTEKTSSSSGSESTSSLPRSELTTSTDTNTSKSDFSSNSSNSSSSSSSSSSYETTSTPSKKTSSSNKKKNKKKKKKRHKKKKHKKSKKTQNEKKYKKRSERKAKKKKSKKEKPKKKHKKKKHKSQKKHRTKKKIKKDQQEKPKNKKPKKKKKYHNKKENKHYPSFRNKTVSKNFSHQQKRKRKNKNKNEKEKEFKKKKPRPTKKAFFKVAQSSFPTFEEKKNKNKYYNRDSGSSSSSYSTSDSESSDDMEFNKKFDQEVRFIKQKFQKQELQNYLRKTYSGETHKEKGTRSLDLCFLVDCTASMKIYVDQVNDKISQIIDEIQNDVKYQDYTLRIAFVGYRDYGVRRFDIIDFVKKDQLEYFKERIKKVKLLNNADFAEDVFGGLHCALGLQWESFSKLLIHFADAPGHGSELWSKEDPDMPSNFDDRYETSGDPDKRDAPTLLTALRKRRIYYTFAKINGTTNTMINKFKTIYDRTDTLLFIETQEMEKDAQNFVKIVVESIQDTIIRTNQMTQSFQQSAVYPINQKAKLDYNAMWHDPEEVEISRIAKSNSISTLMNRPKEIEWVIEKGQVEISKEPFASGQSRTVYKMLYHNKKCLLVAKYFLDPPKEMEEAKQLIERDIISQIVSKRVAKKFNSEKPDQSVDFIEPVLINFHGREQYCYWFCEPFLKGNYKKYSSNNGWKNNYNSAYTAHAFSHFSWQFSKQNFMITDIQGVNYILTDPAIQTKKGEFTNTDLGLEDGIQAFFKNHICNVFCQQVGCTKVKEWQPKTNKILGKSKKMKNKGIDVFYYLLCDNWYCNEIVKINRNIFNKKLSILCYDCKTKRENPPIPILYNKK
ncbi:alpha-protein kinase vwka [Anaeramoeba flamelloides]|uniref:Alpha-protein kinase vwka n=1 Tax=Anaeramoeba flamelloides TaxID=1746091 RepID=A0AAV7ZDB8_9EUKA|nr:alpha-protein kinase vwka [Anaeramoeba flamelloides]